MESDSSYKLANKDVWKLIGQQLKLKDLLSLRQCSQFLNDVVKSMNMRWFRAHQWFVCRHGTKSKVKSAVKKHRGDATTSCFPANHPCFYVGGNRIDYHARQAAAKALIDSGEFTEEDCKDNWHWNWVTPKSEHDIPLVKYNKKQTYLYWYLIECYRVYSPRHKEDVQRAQREVVSLRDRIKELEHALVRARLRLPEAEKEAAEKMAKFRANAVFEGARVNTYKSI